MEFDDIKFLPPEKIFSFYRQVVKGEAPISVMVDTHEPQEIFDALSGYGFAPIRKTLDVGDYVFEGGIAFERKAGDFLNFGDVILKSQELVMTYPHPFLIVEANIGSLLKAKNYYSKGLSSTNFEQLFGTVGRLGDIGVPPLFCQNQYFLVKTMVEIVKKILDTKNTSLGKLDGLRYTTDDDYLRGMYLNLPGVGQVIANSLLKKFPSLEELMGASKEDLQAIDKLGKVKVDKIYKILHRK
jgi:ERCC4-type nuclease